jgi:hypothetical protein
LCSQTSQRKSISIQFWCLQLTRAPAR